MPSTVRSMESVVQAIEAAGWRWTLTRRAGADARLIAAGLAQAEESAYEMRLDTGDYREGRHYTVQGVRLTTVLAAALTTVERANGTPEAAPSGD